MARIFIDGFESGEHDMWDVESNATVVSSAGKDMDGDYCLDLNDQYEKLQKDITANDEYYFAFLYHRMSSLSESIFCTHGPSAILVGLRRNNASNCIEAVRGATVVATGTHVLSINTTYLIEVHIKIADSGGRIEVKVDEVSDIDFTGDTKPDAQTQITKIRFGYCYTGKEVRAYYDNLIIDDAAWIGNTKIQAILPTGAGNLTGWTPSAGANYACVDERPASDADYVSINSNDVVDTYAAGNMVGSIGSVKCVQVQSRTELDESPTPTNLKLVVRSGGTDYLSGDKVVPATPAGLCHLWETNPADSAAWEESDINAMEIGIKSAT